MRLCTGEVCELVENMMVENSTTVSNNLTS